MAYQFNFGGGSTNRTSYAYGSGHIVYSDYGGFGGGNPSSDGGNPVAVYGIAINGLSGGYASMGWLSGSSFRAHGVSNSGTMTFGRLNDNGTNTIDASDGTAYSPRGGLVGYFTWGTVGGAPSMVEATSLGSGQIRVVFSGSGDTGGIGMDGSWQYQYADNPSFTAAGLADSTGTSIFTGTPGTTYWFRSRGHNAVGWSAWSGALSATAVGAPNAPTGLTGTRSTTIPNAISLSWTAPSVPGGTITGYKVYRDGALFATTTGTGTTLVVSGNNARNTSYAWTVKARNAYSDGIGTEGTVSNTFTITSEGVPTQPRTPLAVASGVTPGKITVTWTAPTYAGIGGITGYDVYLSTGALLGSVGSAVLTYDATGLVPGLSYGFYVKAKNAVSVASATPGDVSDTAYATALGDPPAPTGVTLTASPTVPGRLVLAWTYPAIGVVAVTGYTIYRATDNTKLAVVTSMNYVFDGLTPGTNYSYYVRARNTVTDPAGSDGGPQSVTVTATPTSTANQPTGTLASVLTNNTNTTFNGAATITATTATTFTYTRAGSNVTQVVLPSGGTVTNNTNTTLNGSYTIAIPTSTTMTYARTLPNIPLNTATSGILMDTTNSIFNGSFVVTAADSFNKTVAYAKTNANISTRAATGQIVNSTNTIFNGTGFTILSATLNTFSYAKTNANVTEISATGTATDATNRDYYNGTFVVKDVPAYNKFTYTRVV